MAFEILTYLVQHPRAQDSFEGILQWWLLERYIERERTAVEAAVEELVASGLVVTREGRDRRRRFGLNPRRAVEAQAIVAGRRAARREEG
jgi:hypothetical protein